MSEAWKEAISRQASDKQMSILCKIAYEADVAPSALVCAANGMRAGYDFPECTKKEVSKAIRMFKNINPSTVEKICYPTLKN